MRKRKHSDEDQLTFDTMDFTGGAEPSDKEEDSYDILGDIDKLLDKQNHEHHAAPKGISADMVDADSIFDDEPFIKVMDTEQSHAEDADAQAANEAEAVREAEPAEPVAEEAVEESEPVEAEDESEQEDEPIGSADKPVEVEEIESAEEAVEAEGSAENAEAEEPEKISIDMDEEELLRKQKQIKFAKPDILLETPYTVTVGNKQYTRYRLEFGRPDAVIPPELSSSAGVLIPKIEEVDEQEAERNKRALKKRNIFGEIISWVSCVTIAVLIALLITNFVFVFVKVEGDSMLYSLHTDNYLFVWRAGYIFSPPQRGDVVICNFPDENGKYDNTTYIKRVIGLPGETVSIHQGCVYIDGRKLEESYIDPSVKGTGSMAPVVLGEDEFFVLGDNRVNSTDSRKVGGIKRDKIMGQAVQVLYPFDQFAPVK
ncbi:MAG: signal peptidase I [Clostridia bacterium]|nr:signal peptidase I [Clostridia bacterium]